MSTSLCACGAGRRKKKQVVCPECWKATPKALKRALVEADGDREAKRAAAYAIIKAVNPTPQLPMPELAQQ